MMMQNMAINHQERALQFATHGQYGEKASEIIF